MMTGVETAGYGELDDSPLVDLESSPLVSLSSSPLAFVRDTQTGVMSPLSSAIKVRAQEPAIVVGNQEDHHTCFENMQT